MTQFLHGSLGPARSHLHLDFRHWSQAVVEVVDGCSDNRGKYNRRWHVNTERFERCRRLICDDANKVCQGEEPMMIKGCA